MTIKDELFCGQCGRSLPNENCSWVDCLRFGDGHFWKAATQEPQPKGDEGDAAIAHSPAEPPNDFMPLNLGGEEDAVDAARYRKIKDKRSPFVVYDYSADKHWTLTTELDARIDSWPEES